MGGIWQLSESNYKLLLRNIKDNDGAFDLDKFGKYLGDYVEAEYLSDNFNQTER
jgi:hypothetical protein